MAFRKNLQKELTDKNETELRKIDKEKQKRKMESDPESALLQMHGKANDIFTKRAKLSLPEPQVNDEELEQVVKIGTETQNSRSTVIDSSRNFNTNDLLADYSLTPGTSTSHSNLRTPSTISRETNILNEARNIIALNNVQTPLKGGLNPELDVNRVDFSGVTPQAVQMQTPNTVLRTQVLIICFIF